VLLSKHRRKLGDAVRSRRKQAGLSQEKLAEKASLSTVFISHVERGVENISVDALVRIARALKVQVHDLTEGF
jgi:transcriptional regulator with XRE-family HTH domain